MIDQIGWLFDFYADERDGLVLWAALPDGRRLRLHRPFAVTFYAAGPAEQLRTLWRRLRRQEEVLDLARTERQDLFQERPVSVLAVRVSGPLQQERLFRQVSQDFPELTFYDADLQLSLRVAAETGVFPGAHCRFRAGEDGLLLSMEALESPWELDPLPMPLRLLRLEPDCDPQHAEPRFVNVRYEDYAYQFALKPERPMLVNLAAILQRYDPDLLMTMWGDTWLLPRLMEAAQRWKVELPLNREPGYRVTQSPARSYFSYGQIIYKGQQIGLFGRCHIDGRNAMMWGDYGLEGILELTRVTALPIQTAARVSPGTGISSMQILTALRLGILVPWHKQQAERPKTALDLLHHDQGGMVYQPLVGLHRDVGEVDFISMYPSIMVRCNISPEKPLPTDLNSDEPPGLIPQTLAPLLEKRVALKMRLGNLPGWDPRRERDKARSSAHKWLLVTCFGYLGYKNARFGRIEAHEAVTTWGREALLRAKEAAEDLGFTVIQMYVDGLWVQKKGAIQPEDFNELLSEIAARTSLSVALDGVYRWVAFLPSRVNERVAVPNRYFGVFQDGSLKMRGIEARRHDAPTFVSSTQVDLLKTLSQAPDVDHLPEVLPRALRLLRRRLADLRAGRVPLDQLVVAQRLSRELEAYKDPSPAARAALQLLGVGKTLRPGQKVRFVYLRGEPGVYAWDLPQAPPELQVDVDYYRELMLRAAGTVFQPFGLEESTLRGLMNGGVNEPLPSIGLAPVIPQEIASVV